MSLKEESYRAGAGLGWTQHNSSLPRSALPPQLFPPGNVFPLGLVSPRKPPRFRSVPSAVTIDAEQTVRTVVHVPIGRRLPVLRAPIIEAQNGPGRCVSALAQVVNCCRVTVA